jgi:hypothetical protein
MDEAELAGHVGAARKLLRADAAAQAEALLRDLVRALEAEFGAEAPELIECLYLLARALSKQRAWNSITEEEQQLLERALRIATGFSGEDSRWSLTIREALAVGLRAAGLVSQARTHMEIVVRSKERALGEGILLAHAVNGLAEMNLELGEFAAAAALYRRSAAMIAGAGETAMETLTALGQGRALLGLERHAEALPFLELAHRHYLATYGERNRATEEVRAYVELARRGHGGSST